MYCFSGNLKQLVSLAHIIELFILGIFYIEATLSRCSRQELKDCIWDQFKFLTSVVNIGILSLLIVLVYYDYMNYSAINITNRYPKQVQILFQGICSLALFVMLVYWGISALNKSLLEDYERSFWQQISGFYLHGGNWIILYYSELHLFTKYLNEIIKYILGKFQFQYNIYLTLN